MEKNEFDMINNAIIENKKLLIKKNKENKMTIEIIVEYLYKQNIIKRNLNLLLKIYIQKLQV